MRAVAAVAAAVAAVAAAVPPVDVVKRDLRLAPWRKYLHRNYAIC